MKKEHEEDTRIPLPIFCSDIYKTDDQNGREILTAINAKRAYCT